MITENEASYLLVKSFDCVNASVTQRQQTWGMFQYKEVARYSIEGGTLIALV